LHPLFKGKAFRRECPIKGKGKENKKSAILCGNKKSSYFCIRFAGKPQKLLKINKKIAA